MIKGSKKNIVMLKCDSRSPFESAIFILKSDLRGREEKSEDIIEKAYQIIRSGEKRVKGK